LVVGDVDRVIPSRFCSRLSSTRICSRLASRFDALVEQRFAARARARREGEPLLLAARAASPAVSNPLMRTMSSAAGLVLISAAEFCVARTAAGREFRTRHVRRCVGLKNMQLPRRSANEMPLGIDMVCWR